MGTVVGKKNNTSRVSVSQINASHESLQGLDPDHILTPAYYIHSLMKHETKMEIRSKLVSDLSVRLRTMPIK